MKKKIKQNQINILSNKFLYLKILNCFSIDVIFKNY
jgi:hypothetical protein